MQAQALPFGTPVKPEQLYTAAAAGDVPGVRAAVQRSWPSAAVLCEALAQACRGGHGDAMQVLLLHGAPIEPLTAQPSEAPLYSACQGGHLAVAKELLRRGASVDGVSAVHGDTALSCSAALGDPDLVSLLLAHHASLEATFAQGSFGSITPLARVTQAANTLDARLVPSALVDDGRGGGDETRRDDDTGADQSSTRWDACAQLLQDAARTRGGVSRIQQLWYVLRRAVHAWPYVRHWLVEHRAIIAAKEERRPSKSGRQNGSSSSNVSSSGSGVAVQMGNRWASMRFERPEARPDTHHRRLPHPRQGWRRSGEQARISCGPARPRVSREQDDGRRALCRA